MNRKFKIIENEFEGKVALVTGAGTGNGESIAERLIQGELLLLLLVVESHHLMTSVRELIHPGNAHS